MTLDNRVDMSDGFYLQEKVRRLESDVEHHAESHRKANEMLLEERQKVSTLQSNVKMVESEKYRAYKPRCECSINKIKQTYTSIVG